MASFVKHGATISEAAQKFGVSMATIMSACKEFGVPFQTAKADDTVLRIISFLIEGKMSLSAIGKLPSVFVTRQYVQQVMARARKLRIPVHQRYN